VAVEIDASLAESLRHRAPANVEVVTADALTTDLRSLVPEGSRLAGNLPYYVSSPLLRRFLSLRGHVRDLHVMLQDEVARRVASPPGSKEYGILSVLYALWTETDIPARFPPGSFSPPPRVASAVLRARFLDQPRADLSDPDGFERFLQKAFARRRRTLENNLQDSYPNLKEYFRFLNLQGSRRAETLSVVEFAALWRALRGGSTGATG
jgi:16S rRNA (adenine1518-N6/adenine1519-N6)-dimethyltransferase